MTADGDNAVLTQADIDAMLSDSPPSRAHAAAAPAKAAPQAPTAAAPSPQVTQVVAVPGTTAAGDLEQRVAKLEAALGGGQLQAQVQALAQQLQALQSQVNEVLQHLPNTLGYGARASFQCGACSAQGLIAARVLCTHCGTETSIGWWPQQ